MTGAEAAAADSHDLDEVDMISLHSALWLPDRSAQEGATSLSSALQQSASSLRLDLAV